jgi:uncharacterized protein YukE
MTVHLTPAEANARILQVDNAMTHAQQLARNMIERSQIMTQSSWLGDRGQKFAQTMDDHHQDFVSIVNQLTQVAETGKQNIHTFTNADSQ